MATTFTVEFLPLIEGVFDEREGLNYAGRVTFRGALSIDTAGEADLLLRTLSAGGIRKVILNMENVSYIDSTGIGTIIRGKKNLETLTGDLVLVNVPPKINEVLELVNLKDFVRMFYSDYKALEYLR